MNDDIRENKSDEMEKAIDSLLEAQQERLAGLMVQTMHNLQNPKESIEVLQELSEYLRIFVKYVLFDIEATQRENTTLKKAIEDSSS